MKNSRPLGIAVPIKHILIVFVIIPDKIHLFAAGFCQIITQVALQGRVGLFSTVSVFVPQRCPVRGKGFVEAKVAPTLAGDQVAKPMMEHFVGHRAFCGSIDQFPGASLGPLTKHNSPGIFHRPGNEIPHGNLMVARPRIVHPKNFGVIIKHIGGPVEYSSCQGRILGLYIIMHRNISPRILGHREFARRNHGQVGCVR